jgi:hypothetical protein
VKLNLRHPDGEYDPANDDGCGCDVTILSDDEEYNLHRGDSEWSVTRTSDGRAQLRHRGGVRCPYRRPQPRA